MGVMIIFDSLPWWSVAAKGTAVKHLHLSSAGSAALVSGTITRASAEGFCLQVC